MLTGLRQVDILELKLPAIKKDGLHITPSKTRYSSGKSIIIEWDDAGILRKTIDDVRQINNGVGSLYLFSTRKGEPYFKDGSASGFKSIWQRWIKRAVKETALE